MNFAKIFAIALLLCFAQAAFAAAPAVSSSTHPVQEKWYNSTVAYVSWVPVEGAASYVYAYDSSPDTVPGNSNAIAKTGLTLPPKADGTWFFHVKALGSFGSSDTAHFKIQIDTQGPTQPQPTATARQDGIFLEWTPSEDSLSGASSYTLYRSLTMNFTIRDISVKKFGPFSGTSYLDTNDMEEGRTYFYRLIPIDNAGNTGIMTKEFKAAMPTTCTLGIVLDAGIASDKKTLLVGITAQQPIYYSSLRIVTPDNNKVTLFTDNSNYTSWDGNFDLSSSSQGKGLLILRASEFYGDNCDANKEFVFDTALPSVNFVFPKNYREEVNGVVGIKISAEDTGAFKSGISAVSLSYKANANWISIGTATPDSNGLYSLSWNTSGLAKGYFTLKANVSDNAGNLVEKTKEVWVFNTTEIAADTNALISAVSREAANAKEKKSLLLSFGIDSNSFSGPQEEGQEKLDSAKQALAERRFEEAKQLATQARNLFSQANSAVLLEQAASEDFIFNKQQIQILLEAARVSPEIIPNSVLLIKQSKVSRALRVFKVTDSGNNYYKAAIVVSFNFPRTFLADNNIGTLQVLEIIPKDFAASASQLAGNADFNVIVADPQIVFYLDKAFFDSNRQIVYALKQSFSESEAMRFISTSTVNKFLAPPVLIGSQYAISALSFDFNLVLIAAAAVIIIAVILALLWFLTKRKKQPKSALKKW